MADDRIWVTGMGVVTALGHDVASTWPRLVAGERGFAPLALFDAPPQRSLMVAGVANLKDALPTGGVAKQWSRTSAFAWKAAREAMAQAGLREDGPARERRRVGLIVGGTTGGMFETESLLADLHANPNRTDSLVQMISQPLTATGDRLQETLGPFCRVRSLCSACSSGANPFALGALWLLSGVVDAVVVGGSDGLCRLTLSGFNALAATDPDTCRPFDARRKGLNLGEGAGFAVLERASTVRERATRGSAPIAELAGWAVGAEAHHITNPEPTGAAAARVIARCLRRAGLSARDVDYVNAHGTGTPLNDAMETAALHLALGAEVQRVPVSSSKGQVGHMLGAAGAVEAVVASLAIKEQRLVPTMGLEQPDDACQLVHVMHEGRRARVRSALSSSFGFGGMDTVLLFTEPELGPPHARGERRVVVTGAAALTADGLVNDQTAQALVDGSKTDDPVASSGPVATDLGPHLETGRARRLDRPARLAAVVAGDALRQAGRGGTPLDVGEVGIFLGTAFGSLDPSAAFMHRLFEKGPRFASPAEFPNLVPSSPVGHVSIYLGLRGAALATADLATSGESAVLQAFETIAGGDDEALLAGSVEEASDLVERILFSLSERGPSEVDATVDERPRRPRSEGAATLVLEASTHAAARGARALACVERATTWTAAPGDRAGPALGSPRDLGHAWVVFAHDDAVTRAVLAQSAWAGARQTSVTRAAGEHEGLGGVALVAATSLVAEGRAEEVLVIGTAKGRGYAFVLTKPGAR